MRIGIDFDNTIVTYDQVFINTAKKWGIISEQALLKTKLQLRNYLMNELKDKEKWMALQGYVYGKGMSYAKLMPGFREFLKKACSNNISVFIVSHKTKYGHFDKDQINLRQVALRWMIDEGLFNKNLKPRAVYFENTRINKINKIKQLKCTHFIDDLPEVLLDECFPNSTKRCLFSSDYQSENKDLLVYKTWEQIQQKLLG